MGGYTQRPSDEESETASVRALVYRSLDAWAKTPLSVSSRGRPYLSSAPDCYPGESSRSQIRSPAAPTFRISKRNILVNDNDFGLGELRRGFRRE